MPRHVSVFAAALCLPLLAATPTLAQGAPSGAVKSACMPDYKRLCSGVHPGGGAAMACMETHRQELSRGCKLAMAKAAMAKKQQQ